ncbi:unnamed protein product, partial [Ceratitis capitata]
PKKRCQPNFNLVVDWDTPHAAHLRTQATTQSWYGASNPSWFVDKIFITHECMDGQRFYDAVTFGRISLGETLNAAKPHITIRTAQPSSAQHSTAQRAVTMQLRWHLSPNAAEPTTTSECDLR